MWVDGVFFKAEGGIRDDLVTGGQTCALPISAGVKNSRHHGGIELRHITLEQRRTVHHGNAGYADVVLNRDLLAAQQSLRARSEERRVGKESRSRWSPDH